jgi:ferredoxin--NADP+ reductase
MPPYREPMARVLDTSETGPGIRRLRVDAPRVARHWRAGQFVIIRPTPDSERIPLTVAAANPAAGWIEVIVQSVGRTTATLAAVPAGGDLADVVGPLGVPSEIEEYGHVVIVGGGVGTAVAYPTAVALARAGNRVTVIVGGRTKDLVILEDELRAAGLEVVVTTDDGSAGIHGLVTDALATIIAHDPPARVIAAGPIPMMRAVADATRPHRIPTMASLNPIMVDGTGMCGGCRVRVGGEVQFACIDGPEFDAHAVDFDTLTLRNRAYREFERSQREAVGLP